MQDFQWALLGPGRIARRFAQAVQALPHTRLHSVWGRDAARAQAFATAWAREGQAAPQVQPDLATLLADTAIDAVYIATPHALHGGLIRQCLWAGKPVLCEKPLVPTLAEAQSLTRLAQERSVFLMEALWTRFLPVYDQVQSWLATGAIGSVRALQSSFCFSVPFDARSRLFDPALAGGTLLDIGIYNLAMTRWVLQATLGHCPEPVGLQLDGTLAPTGVDQRVAGTLHFPGGVLAQFVCAFDCAADNALRIFGERGHILVPQRFWEATQAVLVREGQAPQAVEAPFRINGFEGEIEEAMRCVRAGLAQSPRMPHEETLALVAWIDRMRQQLGVRYPFEAQP
jgi:predicted dehydrogenase